MDTVVLDGTTYKKASVVAKEFKYTSDYVGQLCRAGKVDAHLVGRTWFVNSDSLTVHKKAKYQQKTKRNPAEAEVVLTNKTKPSRIEVNPVVKSKTMKGLVEEAELLQDPTEKKLHVYYEPDEGSLFPTLHKQKTEPPTYLVVEPANATKIKVEGRKKNTLFTAGELPEVSLSGSLNIEDLPEGEIIQEPEEGSVEPAKKLTVTESSSNEISAKKDLNKRTFTEKLSEKSVAVSYQEEECVDESEKTQKAVPQQDTVIKTDSVTTSTAKQANSFAPAVTRDATRVQVPEKPMVTTNSTMYPLTATVLAFVIALLMFSASSQIFVNDNSYDSTITLQVANLMELLKSE